MGVYFMRNVIDMSWCDMTVTSMITQVIIQILAPGENKGLVGQEVRQDLS